MGSSSSPFILISIIPISSYGVSFQAPQPSFAGSCFRLESFSAFYLYLFGASTFGIMTCSALSSNSSLPGMPVKKAAPSAAAAGSAVSWILIGVI